MKKSKLVIKYIVFSIVLYIVGAIILLSVPTGGGSEMFSGFDEAIRIFLKLLIGISISELIGGIYLLSKNLPKSFFKKALISFLALIIVLFIILYPLFRLLTIFIIPVSAVIINCVFENKKHNKSLWIIIFILLVLRILWQIGDYINFNREQNRDTEYACKNYITSNSSNFYCFSIDQIKKINKNNLDEKIYNSADYLFYDSFENDSFIDNTSNNNYIYYSTYKYGFGYGNYELHVIDINNNTDTNIINLKRKLIDSAITDENGNLFFISDSHNKAYYYQSNNKKITKISNTDDLESLYLDFYYLKNNKIYYEINTGDTIHFYSYNLLNNKKIDNGYIENDSNIIPNSIFATIGNYRYQFYNNEIYKYNINDYSQKITIRTNQDYRVNKIKFSNNKIYYFHINDENSVLLGYYDISNNSITEINYDFKSRNEDFIISGDNFYYISRDDNHLYKYNLNDNNVEEFINIEVNTILGIDMDTIYLKTKINDYEAINLDTKETIFLEKERT